MAGLDGLRTRGDVEAFVRQRLFQERRAYQPWWELGTLYAEPRGQVDFATGWSNASYVATNFNTAAFYLDIEGFVHLKGGVEITDPGYSGDILTSTIFTIPEGYRPQSVHVRPVAAQEDFDSFGGGTPSTALRGARVVVRPDGSVDLVMNLTLDADHPNHQIITVWLDDIPRTV